MRSAALLLVFACSAVADWPQWRGPGRDGQVADGPTEWPEKLDRAWRVPVGEGHSSPVTAGDSVYVFTRENGAETLRRILLADGEEAWKTAYPVEYEPMGVAAPHGKGPKSTPVVADGRVCTLGVTGVLSCHEASSGKLLWRKDFAGAFPHAYPLYGAAMSPLIYNGLLIAHVGGDGGGALIAFDAASGAEKWRWAEDGPGYSSPVIIRHTGRDQLVTQTEQHVLAVDPENGKTLWTLPFSTPYKQNSVTPVAFDDLVVFGGTRQPSFAVRLRDGNPEKLWESTDATLYMSTPVRVGGRLCGFTEKLKGALFCLEPETGALAWISEGRLGSNALVLAVGDRLVASTSEAELIVAPAAGREYSPERIYTVADSNVWAHPALTSDSILIKDKENLTLWRLR